MEKLAIHHRMDGVYGYQTKDNGVIIKLKTKKDDIKKAEIIYGDPFHWRPSKENPDGKWVWTLQRQEPLSKIETDGDFDYYSIKIYNSNKRFKYYFKLVDTKGKEFFYGEQGIRVWTDNIDGHSLGFSLGYACSGKLNVPPHWWTQTDWYQVFPDRFNNPDKKLEFSSNVKEHLETLGGNLKGIIQKINYIKDLGFNGLYLNPIFKATSSHKYDTIDYLQIDEDFGTLNDFKKLLAEAHKRGMKVMLDGVFNHCGYEFAPWQDVLKNKEKSKYKDWFWVNDFSNLKNAFEYNDQEFAKRKPYETFGDTPTMPRLNWENKEVIGYFKKVTEYWTKLGIDGWRLDVADEPSFAFWRIFRKTVKDINPQCVILGEVWYDAAPFLHGDMFDSSMNYPFRINIFEYFQNKHISMKEFKSNMVKQKYLYSHYIRSGLFTLLGSHDTQRITTLFKGDKALVRSLFSLMFLSPGSISFYYGDEYNQVGRHDEDNRFPMDFSDHSKDKTFKLIKKLNMIRKKFNSDIQKGFIWEDINSNDLKFTINNKYKVFIDIKNDKVIFDGKEL